MEESVMGQMTKEIAKLIHLKARRFTIEQQLEKAANAGDAFKFIDLSQELDTIEFKIEVQENYLNEGFNTRVSNTTTVPSGVGNYNSLS
ncbi:MAG: hypothetical protein V2B15_08735 [Bacteroidota bacterium]